jgi:hypothetical protein
MANIMKILPLRVYEDNKHFPKNFVFSQKTGNVKEMARFFFHFCQFENDLEIG